MLISYRTVNIFLFILIIYVIGLLICGEYGKYRELSLKKKLKGEDKGKDSNNPPDNSSSYHTERIKLE